MYHYRLYIENVFVKDEMAENYISARAILGEKGKIFAVEDDGHEIECGDAWINDLFLDYPPGWDKKENKNG